MEEDVPGLEGKTVFEFFKEYHCIFIWCFAAFSGVQSLLAESYSGAIAAGICVSALSFIVKGLKG